jgi:hypothetical protein
MLKVILRASFQRGSITHFSADALSRVFGTHRHIDPHGQKSQSEKVRALAYILVDGPRLRQAGAKHQHVLATSRHRPSLKYEQRRWPGRDFRRACPHMPAMKVSCTMPPRVTLEWFASTASPVFGPQLVFRTLKQPQDLVFSCM